jgi:hypothetical protein
LEEEKQQLFIQLLTINLTFVFPAAGDLGTFSKLKVHFKTEYPIETNLFTKDNRTQAIKTLYTKAGDGKETKVTSFILR